MPKIIDNIEEKIFKAAFKLFAEKGYNSVSMKLVAEDVGIAVGTLYNYHPNKQQLFFNVLKQNIKQMFSILNQVIEREGNTVEFITMLYDQAMRSRGFTEEIIKNSKKQQMIALKVDFIKMMKAIIHKVNERKKLTISAKNEEKLIRLVLLVIIDLIKEFPDEREENITFISNLVDRIYK